METLAKLLGSLFVAGAALAYICNPPAYASPGDTDTVGVQARQVCTALDTEPSVFIMEREVNRLIAEYTVDSENKVMFAAMHYVCPEYMPLAVQAAQDVVNAGGTIRTGVVA